VARYATGLRGHVVVAPATFWSVEMAEMSLCGIRYISVWYQICYCMVLDMLPGTWYCMVLDVVHCTFYLFIFALACANESRVAIAL